MTSPTPAVVFWFGGGLRLHDHPALLAAVDEARASGGTAVPLVAVDERPTASGGLNRQAYVVRTLAAPFYRVFSPDRQAERVEALARWEEAEEAAAAVGPS